MNTKTRQRHIKNLIKRDGNICYLCGKVLTEKTISIDHIIPQSIKPINNISNLALVHEKCNRRKKNNFNLSYWDKLKKNKFKHIKYLRYLLTY